MFVDNNTSEKATTLNDLTMKYEVAVIAFSADRYLNQFEDFYEIKNRNHRLIPSSLPFYDAFRELCGDDSFRQIAEMTEIMFGKPKSVMVFENIGSLINELEGPDGLAPFFFVFDLMFCEFEDLTLCLISGTNN